MQKDSTDWSAGHLHICLRQKYPIRSLRLQKFRMIQEIVRCEMMVRLPGEAVGHRYCQPQVLGKKALVEVIPCLSQLPGQVARVEE